MQQSVTLVALVVVMLGCAPRHPGPSGNGVSLPSDQLSAAWDEDLPRAVSGALLDDALKQMDIWLGLAPFSAIADDLGSPTHDASPKRLLVPSIDDDQHMRQAWLIPRSRAGFRSHYARTYFRKRVQIRFAVSAASAKSVDNALRLFARSQSPAGHWSLHAVPHAAGAAPETTASPDDAAVPSDDDAMLTALVTRAFLRQGYDHRTPHEFRPQVSAAIGWLAQQAESVRQEQAAQAVSLEYLCALAMPLVTAYALTNDPALKSLCSDLVGRIRAQQLWGQRGWLGWGQWQAAGDEQRIPVVDTQLSLEVALVLEVARSAGLSIQHEQLPPGVDADSPWQHDALAALGESMHEAMRGDTLPQRWSPDRDLAAAAAHPSTVLRLAALLDHADLAAGPAQALVTGTMPEQPAPDLQQLLWASEGIFIMANHHWLPWHQRLQDALLDQQLWDRNDPWHGAWLHPQPNPPHLGPLASTARLVAVLHIPLNFVPRQ